MGVEGTRKAKIHYSLGASHVRSEGRPGGWASRPEHELELRKGWAGGTREKGTREKGTRVICRTLWNAWNRKGNALVALLIIR